MRRKEKPRSSWCYSKGRSDCLKQNYADLKRLKANGIIDVENPVAKAQAEGRFEELASDEDSD